MALIEVKNVRSLTRVVLRHVARTRLVYLVFFFSIFSQVAGLKLVHDWLGAAVGFLPNLKAHHSVFLCLFLQVFGGLLLCVVYGVWIAPYLHSGPRAQLTLVLPIKRLDYAMAHMAGLTCLLGVQYVSLVMVFGWVLGFSELGHSFPWSYFLGGVAIEVLCFYSVMFLFAVLALSLGPIASLFGGVMILSALQFMGVMKALSMFLIGKGVEIHMATWIQIYDFLFPAGELVFHLKSIIEPGFSFSWILAQWMFWLLIFIVLYVGSISRWRRLKLTT